VILPGGRGDVQFELPEILYYTIYLHFFMVRDIRIYILFFYKISLGQ
jgi:hypothetical protein